MEQVYKIISTVLPILTMVILFNTILKGIIEKLTKYKDIELYNERGWFITLFIFLGFMFIPFYKIIRRYRKDRYLKDYYNMLKWQDTAFRNSALTYSHNERLMELDRYFKLKKMKKKIK